MRHTALFFLSASLVLALSACATVGPGPVEPSETIDDLSCPTGFATYLSTGGPLGPKQEQHDYAQMLHTPSWPFSETPEPSCFFMSNSESESWRTLVYRVDDAQAALDLLDQLKNVVSDEGLYIATETSEPGYASVNYITDGGSPFNRQVVLSAITGAAELQQYTLSADQPIVTVNIAFRSQ